jgi:hypothetical protein
VVPTTHLTRSLPVIGPLVSLLLEDVAADEDDEDEDDASASGSGPAVDAIVPGISFDCASAAEASKRIEQLILQIISALPTRNLLQIGFHPPLEDSFQLQSRVFIQMRREHGYRLTAATGRKRAYPAFFA